MKYAVLIKPIGNIPYFETMKTMCVHEAKIMFNALGIDPSTMEVETYGYATYLTFSSNDALTSAMKKAISNLSFFYTLFEVNDDGKWLPDQEVAKRFFTDDLSVRLKYNGKTNENFTRMMLNVGLYSSKFYKLDKAEILDPMCGRGTSLFEGLILGHNVFGIDQHKQSILEMNTYFSRYVKEAKIKHSFSKGKAIVNGQHLGEQIIYMTGKNKDEIKKKTGQQLKVLNGDASKAHQFIKKNSIHCIVCDLPYGVQHIGKEDKTSVRNLNDLLDLSVKSWKQVLKNGGTMVMAWNTYTNKRQDIAQVLEKNGMKVLETEDYMNFHHRVSQAINRDIIVAIK